MLTHASEIFLLDEPFSSLDLENEKRVKKAIDTLLDGEDGDCRGHDPPLSLPIVEYGLRRIRERSAESEEMR